MRDARLRPSGHGGFKQVFLAESPARGRFVLKMYGAPPEVGEGERSDPRYADSGRSQALTWGWALFQRQNRPGS